MNEDDRQTRLKAARERIQEYKKAWLTWSEAAAESAVRDLLVGKMIRPDQADFARKIVAHDLHDAGKRSVGRVLAEWRQLHDAHEGK